MNAGTYYIKVYDYLGSASPDEYILITSFNGSYSSDIFEPNNTFREASTLTINTVVYANINPAQDVDFYIINVPETGTLTLRLQQPLRMFGDIYLCDSISNVIAHRSFRNGDVVLDSHLTAGTYYIKISDAWGQSFTAGTGTDAYEPNFNSGSARLISLNQEVNAIQYSLREIPTGLNLLSPIQSVVAGLHSGLCV